ncbi:MAG TPA: hypothetical protein P5287_06390, partial [bacterium]|nr:hypothetical protein [bacterium]
YSSNGKVKYTATTGGYRHYHGYCDSEAGDPLLWSGDSGGGLSPAEADRTAGTYQLRAPLHRGHPAPIELPKRGAG